MEDDYVKKQYENQEAYYRNAGIHHANAGASGMGTSGVGAAGAGVSGVGAAGTGAAGVSAGASAGTTSAASFEAEDELEILDVQPTGYEEMEAADYEAKGDVSGANTSGANASGTNASGTNASGANTSSAQKKKERKPRKPLSGSAKTFLTALAGAAVGCVLVIGICFGTGIIRVGGTTTIGGSGGTVIVTDETTTLATAVAEKALPSVVNIDVYTASSTSYFRSTSTDTLTQSTLGSGVIISEDGYVITNYHVISGASALKVTAGSDTYDAEVVGTDATSDLAVLKMKDASGLTAIEIGDSDSLVVGEWVMSIGSPYGLEQSVATGIVSATSRSTVVSSDSSNNTSGTTMVYTNMIQTDAAINPGNSGGALVNSNGALIGINTLLTSSSGSYAGVGFAIPVNYAISTAKQLIEGKTPTHAQLGVSLATVNSTNAARYGLSVSSGAYVQSVSNGSAASKAGIEAGDIVTKADGKDITSASDLLIAIRQKSPGDTIKLTIVRDSKTIEKTATLGSDA